MSDTYNYVEPTGVIVPDTSSLLAEVQGEFTGAFGTDLELDSSTPQGVLISAEVKARSNVVQNNAAVANQINPNEAEGVLLEAICALTGLNRSGDTFTQVSNVTLNGVQSSPIPAGAIAKTTAGDQFALDAAVTLDPVTGTATGNFTALTAGPVPCGAGSAGLTGLVTDVLGWEGVANSTAGTLGTLAESDEALRALRRNTLFLQGISLIGATLSALWNITGVIGVQGLENVSWEDQTIDGVAMTPKSVWFCVDGGTPAAIATALLTSKSCGADWNGAQSLSVIEPASGQAYLTRWDIPTTVPILVRVTVRQGTFIGDPTQSVVNAVLAFAANSIQGLQGLTVGENASPFEIGSGVTKECPGLYVKLVELALVSVGTYLPAELPMAIYQKRP